MSCCDKHGHKCNQGRNCPERIAKVAKIGRKDYAKEPLRGSPWRVYLRHLAKWLLICLAMMLISAIVVGIVSHA